MHRVARELAHQECGWKHSEGHGVVALDYEGVRHVGLDKMCLLMEGVRHVGLDKMCLLMEVRMYRVLGSSPKQSSLRS
jgi:hypothetical protein